MEGFGMKIRELIESLKKYNQEAGVIISCGNCNHTHSWYNGQVEIEDYTDVLYPFIEMKILTDSKLGTTYQLKGDDRIHFEQDKIKEGNKTIIPVALLDDYLEEYYMEYAIYNYISQSVWVQDFIYDWIDNFDINNMWFKYDAYEDINNLMGDSFQRVKEYYKYGMWDYSLEEQTYDIEEHIHRIHKHLKERE